MSLPHGSIRQVAVCFISAPPFTEVYPLATNEEVYRNRPPLRFNLREIACHSLLSSCQLVALLAIQPLPLNGDLFVPVPHSVCRIAYLFAYCDDVRIVFAEPSAVTPRAILLWSYGDPFLIENIQPTVFTDANQVNHRSRSASFVQLNGFPFSWHSQEQEVVPLSTFANEFAAMRIDPTLPSPQ